MENNFATRRTYGRRRLRKLIESDSAFVVERTMKGASRPLQDKSNTVRSASITDHGDPQREGMLIPVGPQKIVWQTRPRKEGLESLRIDPNNITDLRKTQPDIASAVFPRNKHKKWQDSSNSRLLPKALQCEKDEQDVLD